MTTVDLPSLTVTPADGTFDLPKQRQLKDATSKLLPILNRLVLDRRSDAVFSSENRGNTDQLKTSRSSTSITSFRAWTVIGRSNDANRSSTIQRKTGNVVQVSMGKDNVSKVAPNVIGCGHCETTGVYRNRSSTTRQARCCRAEGEPSSSNELGKS